MRFIPVFAVHAALLLGACTIDSVPPTVAPPSAEARPPADVPLFGAGYRGAGDLCRRAGESDFTNQFLGGGADLVACPPGTDPRLFAFETGGREVARREGWILFSVPHR